MVNPSKFQGIIIDKKKKCHPHKILKIRDKIIKASSSVKLLGVHSKSSQCSDKKKTFSCLVTSTQISTIVPWSGCSLVLNH